MPRSRPLLPILTATALLAFFSTAATCESEPIFRAPYYASNSGPLGLSALAIVAGDFNRDGHRDVATANGEQTVSILLGRGDGTFLPNKDLAAGRSPSGIVTADLNRDGFEDLILASQDSVHVLLGNGDGTFQDQTAYRAGVVPVCVAAADLNSDGMIDVVAGDWFKRGVVVLLGRGDGTLGPDTPWARDTAVFTLKTADVTGDGHPDLLTVDPFKAALTVLPVALDGTIGAAQTYSINAPSHTFDVGDLNRDGLNDVAIECAGGSTVSLLLGQPGGSFSPHIDVATSIWPRSVSLGDVNGDSRQDLVITGGTFSQAEALLGGGDGTFEAGQPFPTAVAPESQILEDINRDGNLDLIANGNNHLVTVHLGNGDGTFGEVVPIGLGLNAEWAALGDLNADGRPDLVTGGLHAGTVGIMRGGGDGSFGSAYSFETGMHPITGLLADVNRDDRLDLVVSGFTSVAVFSGDGAGSFGAKREYPVGPFPRLVIPSDLDRNGRTDLVVVNDTLITVLMGAADGGFGPARKYSMPATLSSASVADFTGDGIPDVAVVMLGAPWGGDESVGILRGTGDGTLGAMESFPAPGARAVTSGDFNRDGRADLAISDASDSPATNVGVWIALGTGDGKFLPLRGFGFGGYYSSVVAADFDLDGKTDLALGQIRTICVLAGQGDGTFRFEGNFGGSGVSGIAVGDVNLDGSPDIVAPVDAFQNDQGLYVLLNHAERHDLTLRVFAGTGRIPLGAPGSKFCVTMEPLDTGFGAGAIDLSTVRMGVPGGESFIRPMDKGSVVRDTDKNGISDVTACFTSEDLSGLFPAFSGPRSVELSVEGSLYDGRRFRGSLALSVVGTGRFRRGAVHPNPLNPDGILSFETSESGPVKIHLFDLQGRLVRVLLDTQLLLPGSHTISIDGRDSRGNALASGVYYYRIDGAGERVTGRFTILK